MFQQPFEQLESRSLRSVNFSGETLLITGTSAADVIVVKTVNTDDINVAINNVDQGTFDVDTHGPDKTEIEIHALAGSDKVTLDANVTLDAHIYGDSGNDTITGGGGQDWIDAGAGNDTVHGGADDDTFVNPNYVVGMRGYADKDEYWGDAGTEDRISYLGRAQAVVVTLDGIANDGIAGAVIGAASSEADNVHTDVEDITGTNSADYLVGNLFSNNISGYGGNDSVFGQSGHDTLFGDEGNDTVYGGEGNDWIFGENGNDSLVGGSGDDSLRGGANSDTMAGGTGTDVVEYENHLAAVVVRLDGVQNDGSVGENDWIKDDVENVTGTQFADKLYGSAGNNVLDGKNGNDSLYGLSGNDTLIGGFGDDAYIGGGDIDTADYTYAIGALNISLDGVANDGIAGEHDNVSTNVEVVIGGNYNDTITGNAWSNTLIGGGGNDTLIGLGGDDQLFGGAGDDSLDGGTGNDTLWGEAGTDVLVGGSGVNVLNP